MNLKELYIKNEQRRYFSVTGVKKENLILEMKPLKKAKKSIPILLIIFVIIIAMLTLNFDIKYFLVVIGMIAAFFLLYLYGNNATLLCDKDSLKLKQGVQSVNIPYKKLKNVYIGKVSNIFFFLPAFSYNIIIRYEDAFSVLRELEFSLFCADENDVEEFINNFNVDNKVEERYVKYEKAKKWRKVLTYIVTLAIALIIVFYFLPKYGISPI